jgi:superfamily II DNA/RNA helicase
LPPPPPHTKKVYPPARLTSPLPPRNVHPPAHTQEAKARVKAVSVTHLTPVQERTLRAVIVDERDVLVQAPTGSGKTLAYLLPIAHALAKNDALVKSGGGGVSYTPGSPSAIVFLPTRELAAQVFAHAEKHVTAAGYPTVLCVGGAPDAPQIAALKAGARVVIGTPGRIKEFVDRGVIKTDAVIVQVLDEADRLLDGGFEMDVEAVMRPPGGQCRTMCLSATMPAQLARFLQRRLPPDHAEVSLHGRGGSNVGGTLEHLAMSCHPNDVVATILAAVDAYAHGGGDGCGGAGVSETKNNLNLGAGDWKKTSVTGQAIVFVETKASAEQLSGTLTAAYEVRPVGFSGVFLSHLCFYPVSRVTFSGSFRWIGLDTFFSFLDRVPRVEGNKRNGATAMVDDYKNPSS